MARQMWSRNPKQIWIAVLSFCAVALAGLHCPIATAGEVECMIWEPGPPDAVGGSDSLFSGSFNPQLRLSTTTSSPTNCANLKQAPVTKKAGTPAPKSTESATKSSNDRSGGWQAGTIRVE